MYIHTYVYIYLYIYIYISIYILSINMYIYINQRRGLVAADMKAAAHMKAATPRLPCSSYASAEMMRMLHVWLQCVRESARERESAGERERARARGSARGDLGDVADLDYRLASASFPHILIPIQKSCACMRYSD
jgi:hypothetical protein